MGPPEIACLHFRYDSTAVFCPCSPIPGRICSPDVSRPGIVAVYEGLILDNQRNLVGGDLTGSDQSLFSTIIDYVARGPADIDVEARDPPGMVVVEHQPGTLLIGIIVGLRSRAGIVRCTWSGTGGLARTGCDMSTCCGKPHIGHVCHTDALSVGLVLSGRGNPLVGRTVADPGGAATVKMKVSPVLSKITCFIGIDRNFGHRIEVDIECSGTHNGGIHWNEEIAASRCCGQLVGKFDAHRPVLCGNNHRPHITDTCWNHCIGCAANIGAVVYLHITPQCCIVWQV